MVSREREEEWTNISLVAVTKDRILFITVGEGDAPDRTHGDRITRSCGGYDNEVIVVVEKGFSWIDTELWGAQEQHQISDFECIVTQGEGCLADVAVGDDWLNAGKYTAR